MGFQELANALRLFGGMESEVNAKRGSVVGLWDLCHASVCQLGVRASSLPISDPACHGGLLRTEQKGAVQAASSNLVVLLMRVASTLLADSAWRINSTLKIPFSEATKEGLRETLSQHAISFDAILI